VRVAEVTNCLAKVLDKILCFSCVVGFDSDASRRALSSELGLLGAFLTTVFGRRSTQVRQTRNLGDLRLFESFRSEVCVSLSDFSLEESHLQ